MTEETEHRARIGDHEVALPDRNVRVNPDAVRNAPNLPDRVPEDGDAEFFGDNPLGAETPQPRGRRGVRRLINPRLTHEPPLLRPVRPLLRPVRQPLYDLISVPGRRVGRKVAFVSAQGQRDDDGTIKTSMHTNLRCAGQLGMPFEYDLVYVGIAPAGVDEEYKRKWDALISSNPVLKWFVGVTTWLEAPLSQILPYFAPFQNAVWNGAPEDVKEKMATYWPLPRAHNVCTPDRRARRIASNESIRMELEFTNAYEGPSIDVYGFMWGILYQPIA